MGEVSRRRAGPWWIYMLVDPRDGLPFYVGMTCNPLGRWNGHCSDWASAARSTLIEIREAGLKCRVRVMGLYTSRDDARCRELELIGRHEPTLRNSLGTPKFGDSISKTMKRVWHDRKAARERRAKRKGQA